VPTSKGRRGEGRGGGEDSRERRGGSSSFALGRKEKSVHMLSYNSSSSSVEA